MMADAKDVRSQLVNYVSSEALYQRLSRKSAALELDPFFVYKQIVLVGKRYNFLRKKLSFTGRKLTFISAVYYDQVVQELDSINENTINLVYNLDEKSNMLQEAAAKLSVPSRMHYLLHDLCRVKLFGPCLCSNCEQNKGELKNLIKMYPESVKVFEKFNENESFLYSNDYGKVKSLKDTCMLRVVECDLPLESLPDTLQRTLSLGPETRWLSPPGKMVLDRLHRILAEMREIAE